jgi:BioD-like phosphotransacetylase family protein
MNLNHQDISPTYFGQKNAKIRFNRPVSTTSQTVGTVNAWRKEPSERDLSKVHSAYNWLERIYTLVASGHSDDALDVLYKEVDSILEIHNFLGCEQMMSDVDLERLDETLLVGLLSVTLPAAAHLSSRANLYTRIQSLVSQRMPREAEVLLAGLA